MTLCKHTSGCHIYYLKNKYHGSLTLNDMFCLTLFKTQHSHNIFSIFGLTDSWAMFVSQ